MKVLKNTVSEESEKEQYEKFKSYSKFKEISF